MTDVVSFDEFKKERSAGGVTDGPKALTHEEEEKEARKGYVINALNTAAELNLEQVVIIGADGDYIHYVHSELGEQRMIYLAEKFRYFVLSGGLD